MSKYSNLKDVQRDAVGLRFWSKVDKRSPTAERVDTPCWTWTGAKSRDGYGQIRLAKSSVLAHRLSFEMANGEIGAGLLVCHRCDTPSCVRPDHLFAGTDRDNVTDMVRKGRNRGAPGDANGSRLRPDRLARGDSHPLRINPGRASSGESHYRAKLTVRAVAEIRKAAKAEGADFSAIGARFGVTERTVQDVVSRRTWKSVPEAQP